MGTIEEDTEEELWDWGPDQSAIYKDQIPDRSVEIRQGLE
uniref:Uncharacterized protein n=1 Tax=Daphnia galeata TaxID=27404 RepID=A0A8J2RMH3_9CRUS|nr:unnamed protein product [Daphnia galeata]